MKAFLLGAGVGSRLRPFTDHTPKCLVPVKGEPLLAIWLRLLAAHGFHEVLLNTHHLADKVCEYVAARNAAIPRVTLFHEPTLLGSAGTVAANRAYVKDEDMFLVAYADNLTNVNLSKFCAFHLAKRSAFSVGLFASAEPTQCGIAELGEDERIVSFVEKPREPKGNLANGGLYLAGPALFDAIPDKPYTDFGFDVLPSLVGDMFGYRILDYYRDLGTPARLAEAQIDWAGGL